MKNQSGQSSGENLNKIISKIKKYIKNQEFLVGLSKTRKTRKISGDNQRIFWLKLTRKNLKHKKQK